MKIYIANSKNESFERAKNREESRYFSFKGYDFVKGPDGKFLRCGMKFDTTQDIVLWVDSVIANEQNQKIAENIFIGLN